MPRSEVGLLLRLIGPLIQVLCLILLLGSNAGRARFLGVSTHSLLYAGFALGLGLVLLGIVLSRKPPRSRD